jgi:hypothetical protein
MAGMTTAIHASRGRLTALRAAWLFDGTSSAMVRDLLVVIERQVVTERLAQPAGQDRRPR